jgi:alkylation response protein AidB-like acyl-CoA dehydrogenase
MDVNRAGQMDLARVASSAQAGAGRDVDGVTPASQPRIPRIRPAELPAGAQALQGEVRAFIEAELGAGQRRHIESWSDHSPEFSHKLGERGWLGMTWPKRYGGHERSLLERYIVIEELLAAGAPVGAHWVADRQSGPLMLRVGTEEQRQRFLPGIAAGDIYFSIGMSEPDAGSDLASVTTSAVHTDGGWLVSGLKTWTSRAHNAHYMITLCRTERSEDRHRGLSQLIIDLSSPGITINPVRYMTGTHHWNEVVFNEAFVPDDMVLGVLGGGWEQVTSELALERSGPERFLSLFPLLESLFDELGPAPGQREAIGVGSLIAQLWTLRRMSLGVAAEFERKGSPATEAALVKDLGTRFEGAVAETCRELTSPASRRVGSEFEELLRLALLAKPGFTLRGGTSEILRSVVAKSLVGR